VRETEREGERRKKERKRVKERKTKGNDEKKSVSMLSCLVML